MTQLINPILIYQSPTKAAPQFLLKLFLSLKSKIGWLHWFFPWSDLMGSIWKWFCSDTLKHSQENKVKVTLMFDKTLKAWSSFAKDCLQVSKLSTFLYFSKVYACSLSSATNGNFTMSWFSFVSGLIGKKTHHVLRVVYKSRQPAKFTGSSARFHRLLSLLQQSR